MPAWLINILVGGAVGGPGVVALMSQQLNRRQDARERSASAAILAAANKPVKDWDLSAQMLHSAEEMHLSMREEMERGRSDTLRLREELLVERAEFQVERKEMLAERALWAQERSHLIRELESTHAQRLELEDQVMGLQRRVQVLEHKLRELGHDPDALLLQGPDPTVLLNLSRVVEAPHE